MRRWTGESLRFHLLCAFAGLVLLAMAWPIFRNEVYRYDDLDAFHLPMRHFYAECLGRGESSVWHPGLFCGFDLHGEGQVGMSHPLHRGLYGLLPLATAFNLELICNYAALLLGTYLFLRRWSLERDAAMASALAFTFGGFNLAHYLHLNMVSCAAHLPWLLTMIDGVVRDDRPRRRVWWGLGLGLTTTSQLLLMHPQVLWYSGMVEGTYALWLAVAARGGAWHLGRLAWWKGLGVLGGAVQLVPTWASVSGSVRDGVTNEFLALGSLPPANLVQLLAPYLYCCRVVAPAFLNMGNPVDPASEATDWRTHEFGLYIGAAVVPLLVWLGLRWRQIEPGRKRLVRWAAGAGILAYVLSLGNYSPLFEYLTRVPTFDLFRVSARSVLILDLALVVLAGVALSDLLTVERLERRALWPLALVPVAALLAGPGVALLSRFWPETLLRPYLASSAAIGAGFALVTGATGAVALAARGIRGARVGLVLLWAADLAVFSLGHLGQVETAPVAAVAAKFDPPPGPPGVRVNSGANQLTMAGYPLSGGYVSIMPNRQLNYGQTAALRVAGVHWIHTLVEGKFDWAPVSDPLPRVRLVTQAIQSMQPGADLEHIDIVTTALLNEPPATLNGRPGRAELVSDRPGNIVVRTVADGRQLLVLNERYHKDWQAQLDGRTTHVVRTNGDFLGCYVPPGEHRVRFRYQSAALAQGRLISLVGFALMGGSLAYRLRNGPRGAVVRRAAMSLRMRLDRKAPGHASVRPATTPARPSSTGVRPGQPRGG